MGTRKVSSPAAEGIEMDLDHCSGTQDHTASICPPSCGGKKKKKSFNVELPLLMQGLGSSWLLMAGKGQELPHSRTDSKTASCHIFRTRGMD